MPAPSAAVVLDSFSAVILTGGSSGIGKSFLEHMAKVCPNALICNLSRSQPPRVHSPVQQELKVRHFSCDLSREEEVNAAMTEALAAIEQEAGEGRVLLVNNAGFGAYGRYPDIATSTQLAMVDVNIRAVLDLTARVLPVLTQRGGAIINVASTAAFQPTAYLATYGATKSFVLHWSLALAEELRGSGVQVLAVCPGPTRTSFFQRAGWTGGGATPPGQEAEAVVRQAWAALRAGRTLVVTGWKNKVMTALSSKLPKAFGARIAAFVLARYRRPKDAV